MMNNLSRQLCAAVRASLLGGKDRPTEAGLILWNAFQRLNATRTYDMSAPSPIQPSEIEAFCRITHLPLEPRHIAVLMAMDRAWLDQVEARQKARDSGIPNLPPTASRPISAEIFDAMMGSG